MKNQIKADYGDRDIKIENAVDIFAGKIKDKAIDSEEKKQQVKPVSFAGFAAREGRGSSANKSGDVKESSIGAGRKR